MPAGYEVANASLVLPVSRTLSLPAGRSTLTVAEDGKEFITVTGEDFVYRFNRLYGAIESMTAKGHTFLAARTEFSTQRAPIDNYRHIKADWVLNQDFKGEFDIHELSELRVCDYTVTEREDAIEIRFLGTLTSYSARNLIDKAEILYRVENSGALYVSVSAERGMTLPLLPRFGMDLLLADDKEIVTYFGLGPTENYIDMHHAAHLGLFETTVTEMWEPYLMPQDCGLRTDTRLLSVTDKEGVGLLFLTDGAFEFATSKYDEHTVKMAKHQYELTPDGFTHVRIDYKNTGVGSNSCGPMLGEKYQLCEENFSYSFRVLPVTSKSTVADILAR